MPETQSKPSAGAYEVATKIACEVYGPYLACANEENKELAIAPLAALIDAALAPLRRCVWQYLEDTIGEQRDPEEIAKALGQYAPASSRELAEALAPWEPESGGGE